MTVIIDTSFYIALLDPTDKHYTRAPEILAELRSGALGRACTTSLVMAECATLIAIRTRKNTIAIEGMRKMFVGEECIAQLLRPSESTETKAWNLFIKINQDNKDRTMSYVDCTNVVLARQHHVSAIVAFDGHYDAWIRCVR
ncbi:MAG: type II toxin-antitoxin system VapC family toxin [Candidatus Lokiarchaeota archaeon]|nr:type II toxin-antitoxin system VapC family toxin [Candidatus Lokiarchaeota archaeon]